MGAFIIGAGVFLVAVAAALAGPAALAKGPVDRITVQGPGLDEPVDIVEAKVLDRFNPWAGQFLGEVLDEPPPTLAAGTLPYQVFFELLHEKGEPQVVYVLSYYLGGDGHPGYIRLPGPGEEWYPTNIGTIIRSTDGHWHEATEPWSEVMSVQLGGTVGSPDSTPSASGLWSIGWPRVSLSVAFAGAVVLLRFGVARSQSQRRGVRAGGREICT